MKRLGWALITVIALALATITGISWYLTPDDLKECAAMPDGSSGQCIQVDAIVAISGGDTAARTDEAIKLYKAGWGDTLIFSGAAHDPNSPSNARAMKVQALAAGVPEEAIAIEEYARDTADNARRTLRVASERGVERIILVTSAYHQRRAGMEFRQTFSDVKVVDHPVRQDKHWSAYWWLTPRGWWLALGELVKIIPTLLKGL